MPNNDGTGPDGKGPKSVNKGLPVKDGSGSCKNGCKKDGPCCGGGSA